MTELDLDQEQEALLLNREMLTELKNLMGLNHRLRERDKTGGSFR